MQALADLLARQALGLAHEQTRPIPIRQALQRTAHQVSPFAAQDFAFGIVAVAAQQRRIGDRVVSRRAAGAFERLPAHELAPAELVDAGVARDAEQPGLDLQRDRRTPVPGPLSLLPRGQRQVVAVVRIAHEALNLAEHGGVVRRECFLDGHWFAARLGHELSLVGLGSAHTPTIEGFDYSNVNL